MAPTRYKISEAEFEKFKAYLVKWGKLLGVGDWEVDARFGNLKRTQAETDANSKTRIATIVMGKSWRLEPTLLNLEVVAAHEMFHVLLADYATAAEERYIAEAKLLDLEEQAVVRLENFVRTLLTGATNVRPTP